MRVFAKIRVPQGKQVAVLPFYYRVAVPLPRRRQGVFAVSPEFTKLCRRLMIATAVAILMPLGAALLLTGASAAADNTAATDQVGIQISSR